MKNLQTITNYLAFAGVALAMIVPAAAQPNQAIAKVIRIKGSARYAATDNVWQPLKVGDEIHGGTIIQSAEKSQVDLVLNDKNAVATENPFGQGGAGYQPVADQDFLRLWENSVLAIDKLTVQNTGVDKISETQLDLRSGRVFGTVKKLAAGSKYEVKSPAGIMGVKGTIYEINSVGIIGVTSGSAVAAFADGSGNPTTQVVMSGQSFDCRTGQYSPIPTSLQQEMDGAARAAQGNLPPSVHNFPDDHNHHYVSPTQGDQGQNNNHQH
jgi:hypothetical protein